MIKDLLVDLTTGIDNDATLDYALSLARTFDAHGQCSGAWPARQQPCC